MLFTVQQDWSINRLFVQEDRIPIFPAFANLKLTLACTKRITFSKNVQRRCVHSSSSLQHPLSTLASRTFRFTHIRPSPLQASLDSLHVEDDPRADTYSTTSSGLFLTDLRGQGETTQGDHWTGERARKRRTAGFLHYREWCTPRETVSGRRVRVSPSYIVCVRQPAARGPPPPRTVSKVLSAVLQPPLLSLPPRLSKVHWGRQEKDRERERWDAFVRASV
jgi:hypothetical protein